MFSATMGGKEGRNRLSGAQDEVDRGEIGIVDEGKRRNIEGHAVIITSWRSAGTCWEVRVALSLVVNEALGAEGHLENCRNREARRSSDGKVQHN